MPGSGQVCVDNAKVVAPVLSEAARKTHTENLDIARANYTAKARCEFGHMARSKAGLSRAIQRSNSYVVRLDSTMAQRMRAFFATAAIDSSR
jgi:hypothetical protein